MKKMKLSQGLFAVVDDDCCEDVVTRKWSACRISGKVYAVRTIKNPDKTQTRVYMHRVIMRPGPGQYVDHIDGDGTNNQRSNLRLCNNSENQRNTSKKSNNKSGFKGVSWDSRRGNWVAFICVNRKRRYIGSFADAVDAARAYDEACIQAHGVYFGRTNAVLGLL